MPKSKSISDNAKIAAATLHLAGTQGWQNITISAVAGFAKIPVAILNKRFAAPHELISVVVDEIDREAFTPLGKISGTPHDRLFDVIMARFDIMQKYRPAILGISKAAPHDRALARALARAAFDSLERMAGLVKIDNPPRPVLKVGIAAIYASAFYVWRKDTSRDMAKTMAAVDRGLRIASKAAEFLKKR